MNRAHRDGQDFYDCLRYRSRLPKTTPVRFQRIFTSRPGYALVMAPFVRVFGGAGVLAGSAVAGVACGVAVVLLGLAMGLRPVQALLTQLAFYLLPTGYWVSRMLAEAPMVLCLLTATTGAVLLLRGRMRTPAVALLAAGLISLCAVKPANGVGLAAALVGLALVRLPFTRVRRAYLLIGVVAVAVLAGNFWAGEILNAPGINETLQDTFTQHFRLPDVPDPWHRLADAVGWPWRGRIAPQMVHNPLVPVAFLLGVGGLFWRTRADTAWLLTIVGLTGAVVVSMHPLPSEAPRLALVTWIPVAFGLVAMVNLPSWAQERLWVQPRDSPVGQVEDV